MMNKLIYVLDGISVSPYDDESRAIELAIKKLRSGGINPSGLELDLIKKSVDARKKDDIKLVYSVSVVGSLSARDAAKFEKIGARAVRKAELEVAIGNERMTARPMVVASTYQKGYSMFVDRERFVIAADYEIGLWLAMRTFFADVLGVDVEAEELTTGVDSCSVSSDYRSLRLLRNAA